ncbi:hypothetical protein ACHAWF_002320 [Thalassiosira exigua]
MPRRGGGRIRVHERTVDDQTQIIDAGTEIAIEHTTEINATEQSQMEDKTRKEYRNRIRHIIDFWMENYPDYFESGTRVLTEEEKNDTVKFHHKNNRDIIYSGLNVTLVKSFVSVKKTKRINQDGKPVMSSVSDIKKYDDAIKWGSQRAGQPLPSSYYRDMEMFITAYKKEFKAAQKDGRTDEQEADPITATLFCLICKWAVNAGNIFVWVFSLLMWHLMSRSISIDSIAFHNIKMGTSDSIKFKFDETKADKTGELVQEKNCYANPKKSHLCLFLAMACWISINAEKLENTERLFINPGSKLGSASQRYCCQLAELISEHYEEVKRYLQVSRFNAHGWHLRILCNNTPTFLCCSSCSWRTVYAKILDVYFKFAMGGDQFLGRLLVLLNPRDGSFADLTPHLKDPSHPTVLRGIKVAFGDVIDKHQDSEHDPSGLMSLLLASLVHHSPWLLSICSEYPDHPFHTIPLLGNHELLSELKSQHIML